MKKTLQPYKQLLDGQTQIFVAHK